MWHRLICPLGSESVAWWRKGMQPDLTLFLCPVPLGPSNPLFSNKVISLQVPTLLSGMAIPPKHLERHSSPPPALLPSLAHPSPLGSFPQRTVVFSALRLGSTPPTCCFPSKYAESLNLVIGWVLDPVRAGFRVPKAAVKQVNEQALKSDRSRLGCQSQGSRDE